MIIPRHLMCWIAAASMAVALSLGGAAAQSTKPFEPTVGQEGKDVVWVPTPQELVDRMLAMAKVTPQDYVIDLGSGDGRTVITAAKLGAKAKGIEYDERMVELSRSNAEAEKVSDRATFEKADIFQSNFSQASVITMFLLEDINLRLRPKLLELKPGTRLVSNTFTMGDWKHDGVVEVTTGCTTYCKAYLWIVPARVAGTWQLTHDAADRRPVTLVVRQRYQTLSGTARPVGGRLARIAPALVKGDEVTFKIGGAEYQGRLDGERLSGTYRLAGRSGTWSATRNK